MRNATRVLITALLCAAVTEASAKTTLKLAHVVNEQSNHHILASEFKKQVEKLTNGEVQVEIFCCGKLGTGERELIEGLQLGEIDAFAGSTGTLGNFSPKVSVFDLPFLFRDDRHVDKVLDGPIGRGILDTLEPAGIKGLAFAENGWRSITNNKKPVKSVADVQGLKIRTLENKLHVDAWKSLGANPVPMAWGEVRNALQQGVIDGQENPVNIIHSFKLWEVQKHFSPTRHVFSPSALLMNSDKFKSLSPDLQQKVLRAATLASTAERKWIRTNEKTMLEEIKKRMQVVPAPNRDSFKNELQGIYDQYAPTFGPELIKQIQDTR